MAWVLSGFPDEADTAMAGQVDTLRRAGLNHIDLRGIDKGNISDCTPEQAHAISAQLDAAGLKVNMFGTPIGKIDIADDFAADLERLDNVARLATVFGCNKVRVFSYYNKHGASKEQWQRVAIERLGQLRDAARAHGLVLYHENERHIFGDRLEDVLCLLDALHDGQTFRSVYDFDNYNQSGEDCWQAYQALRDRTDALHLKESDRQNQHVPIGEGAGYAPQILADLLSRGWSGSLSLEPHLAHSPAVMATGPSGQANQKLADMTPVEVWLLAAQRAQELLARIGAEYD